MIGQSLGQDDNRYLQQANQYYSKLTDLLKSQNPYNPQTDPVAQSYQQQFQQGAQQASNRAMADMNRRGILDSSITGDRVTRIQQEANQGFQNLIPGLAQNHYARQQQQIGNTMNMFNTLLGAGQNEAARREQMRQFDVSSTGRYIPAGAQGLISQLLDLKREAETPGAGAQRVSELRGQADQIRNQLRSMGIQNVDELFGADVNLQGASQNIGQAYTPTLAAQNQQFNQGISLAQLLGQMPDGTLTTAEQQRQLQNEWRVAEQLGQITPSLSQLIGVPAGTPTQQARQFAQTLGIQQQNANTSRANSQFNQAMELWKATGVAPEGIPGVEAGTRWKESNPSPEQFQAEIIDGFNSFDNVTDALGWISSNSKEITSRLGAKGYEEMRRAAQNHFDDPSARDESSLRREAVRLAQNDIGRWNSARTDSEREALINQYMDFLRSQSQPTTQQSQQNTTRPNSLEIGLGIDTSRFKVR